MRRGRSPPVRPRGPPRPAGAGGGGRRRGGGGGGAGRRRARQGSWPGRRARGGRGWRAGGAGAGRRRKGAAISSGRVVASPSLSAFVIGRGQWVTSSLL